MGFCSSGQAREPGLWVSGLVLITLGKSEALIWVYIHNLVWAKPLDLDDPEPVKMREVVLLILV